MRIDGFGVVVNRLALIIEIEDELNCEILSLFRMDRDALTASAPDDSEYRLFVSSLRTALAAGASRVECRRENSSKLLSCLLLSIKMIRNKNCGSIFRCLVQWNRDSERYYSFFVYFMRICFIIRLPCENLIPWYSLELITLTNRKSGLRLSDRETETDAMFTNVETKLMTDFQRSIHISTKITESPLLRL